MATGMRQAAELPMLSLNHCCIVTLFGKLRMQQGVTSSLFVEREQRVVGQQSKVVRVQARQSYRSEHLYASVTLQSRMAKLDITSFNSEKGSSRQLHLHKCMQYSC